MTQEEKAKRYDKAIERAKNTIEVNQTIPDIVECVESLFPELAESDDERIRKALVRFHKSTIDVDGIKGDDVLAWLEKQGNLMKALQTSNAKIGELIEENYYLKEQLEKQGKNNMGISEATKQKLEDNLNKALEKETPESCNEFLDKQGEQKPIKEHNACEFCEDRYGCVSHCSMKLIEEEKPNDKVKPKFHEGDWVVYCNDDVDLITGIEENGYCINNSGYIPFICENEMRLWDITDAKVGDVLVSESTCGLGTWYCIFKSLDGDESMTVYCYLARDGRFETKKELCFDKDPYNTKPATKEHRDTLLKAMADAGYTFDFEKKELKKIEQKPTIIIPRFRVGDEIKTTSEEPLTITKIDDKGYWSEDLFICDFDEAVCWNLVEQKPAWNEEDEINVYNIIHFLEEPSMIENNEPCKKIVIDWLKSLKERYTWKPSDEQTEALDFAADCIVPAEFNFKRKELKGLLEQLKKLREK